MCSVMPHKPCYSTSGRPCCAPHTHRQGANAGSRCSGVGETCFALNSWFYIICPARSSQLTVLPPPPIVLTFTERRAGAWA